MLLTVLDANGALQQVVAHGQEAAVDRSGTIAATGTAQIAIPANALRSGWLIQNTSNNPLYVNELGDATATGGSFIVKVGETFPPFGFPLSVNAISVLGTVGDSFTAREW